MADKLYKETKDFLEEHVSKLLKKVAGTIDQDMDEEVFGESLLQR